MIRDTRTSAGQSRWVKLVLVLLFLVPPVASRGFDPAATPDVVQAVLSQPVINDVTVLVVLAKFTLLAVAIACLVRPALLGPLGWGYYAVALVVTAVGQNISRTDEFGWVWLVGNTVVQLVVAAFVCADVLRSWTTVRPDQLRRGRLWVLVPMALAWLFPYVHMGDHVAPGLAASVLVNESGLTYCMVTPVVLGLMILYSDGVHPPTLAVAAWVGLLFGVINAASWFALSPANWWMGVLHLPLVVLSTYAVWLSRRRHGTASAARVE